MNRDTEWMPAWPPNWVNAAGNDWRSYSSPDSVMIASDGVTRCAISTAPTTFVSVFSSVFMVLFWIVCWFTIPEAHLRIAFITLGTFCGITTFGLIYALLRYHRRRGDYIVIDHSNGRVILPRHHREFSLRDVCCLQLLTGRDKNDSTINNSDLNLCVEQDDRVVRYHLMGNPKKSHAEAIAQALETHLYDQSVPTGWYRSSDHHDNGPQSTAK